MYGHAYNLPKRFAKVAMNTDPRFACPARTACTLRKLGTMIDAFSARIFPAAIVANCARLLLASLLAAHIPGPASQSAAWAADACGELANGYGPYDYWTDKNHLPIVEKHHFAPQVESLRGGQTSYIGDDIAYVLHAFPNHPRALNAMVRLARKENTRQPEGARYTVDCYFERAIRFRPQDATVRILAAGFLGESGKKKEAVLQLEAAQRLGAKGADFDYSLGQAYFEVGEFDKSLALAHSAARAGLNLEGLRIKLVNAGKWRDPVDTPVKKDKPAAAKAIVKKEDARQK